MDSAVCVRTAVLCSCAVVLMVRPGTALPKEIRIGGLFDRGDSRQQVAFHYAVDRVNKAQSPFRMKGSRLVPIVRNIPADNSFLASKRVCELLSGAVAAIFGPQGKQTAAHVQSICDAKEIPHIESRSHYSVLRQDYSLNLYPHPKTLSRAYLDLVRLFGWYSFCLLYEDSTGLVRLQELLKTPLPNEFQISVRQLPEGANYRDVLRQIKQSGVTDILLDCDTDKVQNVLKQAQQIGMMTALNNFIITSLDTHMLDMEDYKYGGTNITALRLLDTTRPAVKQMMNELTKNNARFHRQGNPRRQRMGLRRGSPLMETETALMYDAVQLFVTALQDAENSTDLDPPKLDCDGEEAWRGGYTLINYLKMVDMPGLTGQIQFDSEGIRTNIVLDIVQLEMSGFQKVGSWKTKTGANYTKTHKEVVNQAVDGLKNKTLIVSFAFTDPYIMRKKSPHRLTGNNRFEGFCVSLLEEISKFLEFNYTLVPIPNDVYGSKDPITGEWNGMIRELLDGRADMAITDLTINYERQEAVDFTMPFMNLGISIIYKKPQKMAPSLFSFMAPLSLEVWIYMITAYFGVSAILFILSRLSPYEWNKCGDINVLENQFSWLNCMWFAIGSLMQQGCDFLPRAVSTRMVAGMWWFFTLIMISSYTANLAAFLTIEQMESPINNAEDLSKQTKIQYGAYASGATMAFFRNSQQPTYERMYQYMNSTPGVFMATNSEGFQRVKESNGNYAFLSESTSIEYMTERHCDLTQVGGLLDSKSYGIALPPGSPYKDALDVTILTLQAKGRLFVQKEIWWKQKHGGGKCKEEEGSGGMASELNLDNVGGVFVVLLGGMGLAAVVAVMEFIGGCKTTADDEKVPFKEVLMEELKFIAKFRGNFKPERPSKDDDEEEGDADDDDDEDQDENDGSCEDYQVDTGGPMYDLTSYEYERAHRHRFS